MAHPIAQPAHLLFAMVPPLRLPKLKATSRFLVRGSPDCPARGKAIFAQPSSLLIRRAATHVLASVLDEGSLDAMVLVAPDMPAARAPS